MDDLVLEVFFLRMIEKIKMEKGDWFEANGRDGAHSLIQEVYKFAQDHRVSFESNIERLIMLRIETDFACKLSPFQKHLLTDVALDEVHRVKCFCNAVRAGRDVTLITLDSDLETMTVQK